MKKLITIIFLSAVTLMGCTSTPDKKIETVEQKSAIRVIDPAIVDFGQIWTGVIRADEKWDSDLSEGIAQVTFNSEWTRGEYAGNVYPKEFILVETGKSVNMDFRWDNGGDIPAGVYDIFVGIDGLPKEGWIRNIKLSAKTVYEVYITFNAAKLNIPLETDGDEIAVYPSGTHDKYEGLGRLTDIPKDMAISLYTSYTERNQIYWLIPAVPVDIEFRHSNGTVDWYTNYTAIPESFINKLP